MWFDEYTRVSRRNTNTNKHSFGWAYRHNMMYEIAENLKISSNKVAVNICASIYLTKICSTHWAQIITGQKQLVFQLDCFRTRNVCSVCGCESMYKYASIRIAVIIFIYLFVRMLNTNISKSTAFWMAWTN